MRKIEPASLRRFRRLDAAQNKIAKVMGAITDLDRLEIIADKLELMAGNDPEATILFGFIAGHWSHDACVEAAKYEKEPA